MKSAPWPVLNYLEAKDTYATIHLWTQIAGKIKIAMLPWVNHSWHVTLQVTAFGLTTGNLPGKGKDFQINFNFLKHQLELQTSAGEIKTWELAALSVAGCYHNLLAGLKECGLDVAIHPMPNELENPIPLPEDETHYTYNPKQATDLHQALLKANAIFTDFRSEFTGKCSPVHLFWGSFDLAVTRFSGRRAPLHPGGVPNLPDWVAQEAYSHEVSSCGFWPGSDAFPEAAFYCYFYPAPEDFDKAAVTPKAAYFDKTLQEFILPYKAVQQAENPKEMVLDFLHSTYQAGAKLANWDRKNLELDPAIRRKAAHQKNRIR